MTTFLELLTMENIIYIFIGCFTLWGIINYTQLRKSIREMDLAWYLPRSRILALRARLKRPDISEENYLALEEEYKKGQFQISQLHLCINILPLLGILGTLLAVFNSNLSNLSSLSESFQYALITTILGIIFSVVFRILLAWEEPRFSHLKIEFEAILEDIFKSRSPEESGYSNTEPPVRSNSHHMESNL